MQPSSNLSKISIAIADDHTLVRRAVVDMIKGFEDFDVMFDASNGAELIEYLETCSVKPEICVLDIEMPVLNGFDTLKILKNRWPEIKVLVLTMIANEITIIKMLKAGANGYMLKAGDPLEFERALRAISSQGFFNSDLSKELLSPANKMKWPNITEREIEFLKLCSTELTYRQIADKTKISA